MKKEYKKPILVKHAAGAMNKFGNYHNSDYRDSIDGIKVSDLVSQYGSPLFVFSEKQLRTQYRTIYNHFSTRYPNVQFSWSYKTNYMGAICSLFHQEGSIAEVVSGFEYEKARHLGVPGKDIIFNGPNKSIEELKRAFSEDAIVNIDNFDEILLAEFAAKELNKVCEVGIRLKIEIGDPFEWDKFGFNLRNDQALDAVRRITGSKHLKLRGLHTHIGTFVLEPSNYAKAVEKMLQFMKSIEQQFNIKMEYIDLGGGFPSKNRLKGIYQSPEVSIPDLGEYAEAICNTLLRYLKPDEYPKLYMETGRAMVDEAGYLISSIVSQKNHASGLKSYFLDVGINSLYTATWYDFKIVPEKMSYNPPESCRLYGPLCMNIDVVAESIYIPPLSVGERVVISPVGAYNVTQWMQFITYRPALVMIMEDGSTEIIRRREKLEDVIACENVPQSLEYKQ